MPAWERCPSSSPRGQTPDNLVAALRVGKLFVNVRRKAIGRRAPDLEVVDALTAIAGHLGMKATSWTGRSGNISVGACLTELAAAVDPTANGGAAATGRSDQRC